ncbi:unnamed protein product [Ceutorhynchus assimilis]|uniref:Cytochrome P450 n=1 Tax=Ceutorhynchus assimilis TaxID=467358 RepID=A0A9N9ML63_9CUCU|nr:unnamed protein product [Ceutorhynchus assimilis]
MAWHLAPIILSLCAFLVVILVAVITFYKNCFLYFKSRGIPFLKPSIPFGNATSFFLGKVGFGALFRDWYLEIQKNGWPIGGAYFCGKPVYIPVDNEIIKKILVSDFIIFPNHGLYIEEKSDPLSGHLFNMEGYKWKNLRAKLPSAFTAAKMRKNVVIMEGFSRELVKRLDQNQSINIKDVLSRFSIDIISACAFGLETETLKQQNQELTKQARAFFDVQWCRTKNSLVILIPRHILSLFQFRLFPKKTTNFFMNLFKDVKEQRQKETTKRNDLTDLLLDLCVKTNKDFSGEGTMEPLNFNEMAAQMYVFFEAGFETSSSTLTLTLYELAANLNIQTKLRQEINNILEKYNGQIGYDAINEMEYLDRVFDETLRKYPIFPILPRICTKDYAIPGTDVTIEKNAFIMVTNFGIQYDPRYYPDPMKFDPERFTDENKAKRPYCSYAPFGEGPRICVGKRFGIWQTKIGLAAIIKNYNVTLSKKMKLPFTLEPSGLVLRAKGDVWLDFEKINTN